MSEKMKSYKKKLKNYILCRNLNLLNFDSQSATQQATPPNLAESREWSVFILGSLWLHAEYSVKRVKKNVKMTLSNGKTIGN